MPLLVGSRVIAQTYGGPVNQRSNPAFEATCAKSCAGASTPR